MLFRLQIWSSNSSEEAVALSVGSLIHNRVEIDSFKTMLVNWTRTSLYCALFLLRAMRVRAKFDHTITQNTSTKRSRTPISNTLRLYQLHTLQNQLAGHNIISRMARHAALLQGLTIGKDREEVARVGWEGLKLANLPYLGVACSLSDTKMARSFDLANPDKALTEVRNLALN